MRVVHCRDCGKTVSNDEVALNIKIYGKQIGAVSCYDCMAGHLVCEPSKLIQLTEFYKSTGCSIFQTKYTEKG
ncbi:MAG: hypothetical protein WBI07_07035 [Mobilitalea sp.]